MTERPSRRPWTTRVVNVVGFVALLVGCSGGNRDEVVEIEARTPTYQSDRQSIGQPLDQPSGTHRGFLHAGETVVHPLPVEHDEAIVVEVDQSDLDVEIQLLAPNEEVWLSWDTPTNRGAPERLCFVAAVTGTYQLSLRPFRGSGGYEIRLVRRRKATEADQLCFRAARSFQAAGARELPERIAKLEAAAATWEQADEPFLAGLAWREAASGWLDLGPPYKAVDRFENALARAQESHSTYLEVSVLNRLGLALIDLGEFERARASLEQAETRARETGDPWGRASALTNLGLLDDLLGYPHRAIDRFSEALAVWRQLDEPIEIAQALQNMAVAYGVLDHHDRALDLLAEALALTQEARAPSREANVLFSEAWIHYLRSKPADGLPALERVLEIRRAEGDRNGEAVALDRMGTLLREADRLPEAEQMYRRSLALSTTARSSLDASATVANLGCLYIEMGRFDAAQARLSEALERYRAFDDPRAISHVEYCLARAYRAEGNLPVALDHLRIALDVVEELRDAARRGGHYYRPIWLWQEYAELEVEILLERYWASGDPQDLARAFRATDLARARTLFERVVETKLGVRVSASQSLLTEEQRLQAALNRKARERKSATANESSIASIEREIRRLRAELERVRAAIRASDPRHAASSPSPVTVEQAQALIGPDTALLIYVLGDDQSHLLTLHGSGLTVHELPSRHDLEGHARALYHSLNQSRTDRQQWHLITARLGGLLLPKEAIPPQVERLIVVPDGLLNYVPFAMLTSPQDDGRLMVDDYEISYVPSVSILASLRNRSRRAGGNRVAVFADPVFDRGDERLQAVAGGSTPNGGGSRLNSPEPSPLAGKLPRLPASRSEAKEIARLAGEERTWLNLDFAARRDLVLETDLSSFRILHFATHAWIDERFPELSGLALSRFDPSGRSVESELRLHEIYGLSLNAELTVLSGCDTALGERVRGNGLEGFTHGFLYAGSSRVMVTLWKVDDRATALLMAEFYRHLLRDNESPARALRAAQNWLRQQPAWQAPYYWAPFVLEGDS